MEFFRGRSQVRTSRCCQRETATLRHLQQMDVPSAEARDTWRGAAGGAKRKITGRIGRTPPEQCTLGHGGRRSAVGRRVARGAGNLTWGKWNCPDARQGASGPIPRLSSDSPPFCTYKAIIPAPVRQSSLSCSSLCAVGCVACSNLRSGLSSSLQPACAPYYSLSRPHLCSRQGGPVYLSIRGLEHTCVCLSSHISYYPSKLAKAHCNDGKGR